MKKIITAFLLANLAHAINTVAVLEIVPSGDVKLKVSEYRHLTDELRTRAREVLPQNGYTVLTRDNILQLLPPDSQEAECLSESCSVDIGRAIGAEYVSQGFVGEFGDMLTLTVELYESMSGNLLGSFVTESSDIMGLLRTAREKAPDLYARILKSTSGSPLPTPSPQPAVPVPATGGTNVVAKIVTEPAGAALQVNGIPYQNCQKTPCTISLYENRFKLSAILNEHETVDTNLVITMPNQTVTIKLKPKTYSVNFASEPSGVSLNFNGKQNSSCRQTPCSVEFAAGNVKVSASLNLYESKDTTISVSGSGQRVNLNLKPKTYSVNFTSEPSGVPLNFNGKPNNSCRQTPCSVEFAAGNVKVSASLNLYESKDTTISVSGSGQRVNLKLKPDFGVLEIKPVYSEGIGDYEKWNLIISGQKYDLGETMLSPGNYEVKLSHGCYEDINFEADINKSRRKVFNMSSHIKLKRGELDLAVERDGEPSSEPVFVNGKYAGKTPFSGSVPLCSEIVVGDEKEEVDVELAQDKRVAYTHKMRDQFYSYNNNLQNNLSPRVDTQSGKGISYGFWGGIALEALGAAAIITAITKDQDVTSQHKKYRSLNSTSESDFKKAYEKIDDAKTTRNVFYVLGGVFLAAGIGVHIWF